MSRFFENESIQLLDLVYTLHIAVICFLCLLYKNRKYFFEIIFVTVELIFSIIQDDVSKKINNKHNLNYSSNDFRGDGFKLHWNS